VWEVDLNPWSLLISCPLMNCALEENLFGACHSNVHPFFIQWLIVTSHASHVNLNFSHNPRLCIQSIFHLLPGSPSEYLFVRQEPTASITARDVKFSDAISSKLLNWRCFSLSIIALTSGSTLLSSWSTKLLPSPTEVDTKFLENIYTRHSSWIKHA